MAYNFDKMDASASNLFNTSYDYGSLMHYDAYAFSTNGQPTIVARQTGVTMGQRNTLSAIDAQTVRLLYNCSTTGVTLPPVTTSNPGTECDLKPFSSYIIGRGRLS